MCDATTLYCFYMSMYILRIPGPDPDPDPDRQFAWYGWLGE